MSESIHFGAMPRTLALLAASTAAALVGTSSARADEAPPVNTGKVAFSNSAIDFKAPNAKAFKTAFKWPNLVYGRYYLKSSLATAYAKKGWDYSAKKLDYHVEVKFNGKVVRSKLNRLKSHWSTFQLSWNRQIQGAQNGTPNIIVKH